MTPDEAVAAARFGVKHGHYVEPEVVGVLLAELDARGVAIERVRELCDQLQFEAGPGARNASSWGHVWDRVRRALDGRP